MERGYKIVDIVEVKVLPIRKILDKYLPDGVEIDFMNIDVEGMDFDVIQSNDWEKYRPAVLLVEIPAKTIEELLTNQIYIFLKEQQNYSLFAKCFNTCIFVSSEKLGSIKKGELK